ncbi:MAG: pyridoxal-phosphate dependent enzyme [Achromobacter pestifer]
MKMNPSLSGLRCIRCANLWLPDDYPEGCPTCLAIGHPATLECCYDAAAADNDIPLPVLAPITLGEGATPQLEAMDLAASEGIGQLWLKCESANPTGSHKDRMAAQLVSRARLAGATRVAAASSGNAGVSLAAYCAAAGLQADIAITRNCPPLQREAMQRFGAKLTAFEDSLARWPHVSDLCRNQGAFAGTNYLNPPVGTHPYGVEGYKPIAQEILDDCGTPTDIIVPTARGDLLWGIFLGWQHLLQSGRITRLPRLHAVEPYARLSRARAAGDARGQWEGVTDQYSIAGGTCTLQSLEALSRSDGVPVEISDAGAAQAQQRLERRGLSTELSSAAALAAVSRLRRAGVLDAESSVVLIVTSDGRRG